MTSITANIATEAGHETNEANTNIQSYLQSFNKEIGEDATQQAANDSTFFQLDAHVINSGATDQEQTVAVQGSPGSQDANGYQTIAFMQDSTSGGYVLIVQPDNGGQGGAQQVQIPANSIVTTTGPGGGQHLTLNAESLGLTGQGQIAVAISSDCKLLGTTTSVDQTQLDEKDGEDRGNNDISVYDFEEGHAQMTGQSAVTMANASVVQADALEESEDLGVSSGNEFPPEKSMRTRKAKVKSSPSTQTTPAKRTKTASTSASSSFVTPTSTPLSQHMCNYCNYTSSKRYLLSRHMKSHSEDRPHKCGICERGFKTIASLNNHVNTHTGVRPHCCKYCDASFTTSGELVRHVRYRHTHEKPHRCPECDYASVELSKLKRHMRCHTGERPYQCPHCTYASPDTYKLKRHLRIHTGEKPYECDVCHARFTQSNSLKAHRLIHSGNKPIFKCDLCPTTCGRKTDLRIHVQKLHTAEKPLMCKRCDQAFPDRYSFKIHLKSHEGEKCFKCDLCNYASVSARHLESHMLIHTDQKPFMCDECDQSFRQKQLLKRHKNLYHNPEYIPPAPKEKTHECPNCSKAFRHKGNLMRHLALHDPDAYKDSQLALRSNENHQLIDEEEEEEDEDIMLSSGNSQSMDDNTMDGQALQFTLDPQTQQMLSGEQVVVFEVVQLNNGEQGGQATAMAITDANGEGTQYATLDGAQLTLPKGAKLLTTSSGTGKAGGGVRTLRLDANALKSSENYIIQLQGEEEPAPGGEEEAHHTIVEEEYTVNGTKRVDPPLPMEEGKGNREQLQKQKDFSDCFGFKDDDDEDEAILSMPAAHAQ